MSENVFVYGTLRQGQRNHFLIKSHILSVQKAKIRGQLYHLSEGYPTVVKGDGEVIGELITLIDVKKAFDIMDELEGYQGAGMDNDYERIDCRAVTEDGGSHTCQVYISPEDRGNWFQQHATFVPNGDWARWK